MLARTLEWFTRRPGMRRKACDVYGKVVAAAREPGFYGAGRVADTPEGRFELVALHLFLVVEQIKRSGRLGQSLAQNLIETFVIDMDDCMREMGVGDLTVPKRVKRAAAVFYERAGSYRTALALPAADAAGEIRAVIANAMLGGDTESAFAATLAAYVQKSQALLASAGDDAISAARFSFAAPPASREKSG